MEVRGVGHSSRQPGSDDIEQQFRLIREDVTDLAKLIKKVGESKSSEARDAALAEANELLERSRSKLDEGVSRARRAAASVEDYIHEKPVQSALIALGVGFLVGIISRR